MIKIPQTLSLHIQHFGWFLGVITIIFHPIILPFFALKSLVATLAKSIHLISGKNWGSYLGFHPLNSINALFYKRAIAAIDTCGRYSKSPYVGTGNFHLAKWFQYTLFSLKLYTGCGALCLIFSGLFWVLSHLFWMYYEPWEKVIFITTILASSVFFYTMTFVRQNYNYLGWMLYPAIFLCVHQDLFLAAGLLSFLSAFLSFSSAVCLFPFFLTQSLIDVDVIPLISYLPCGLKLTTHFIPMISDSNRGFIEILKAIGFSRRRIKYHRIGERKFSYYDLILLASGLITSLYLTTYSQTPHFLLVSLALLVINRKIARFADIQSINIIVISTFCFEAVKFPNQSDLIQITILLILNPFPMLLNYTNPDSKSLLSIRSLEPYSVDIFLKEIELLLKPVKKGDKVLVLYPDPNNEYGKCFANKVQLQEALSYYGTINNILILPDWWSVFELNYEGAHDLWFKDLTHLKWVINKYNIDWVITDLKDVEELGKNFLACIDRNDINSHFFKLKYMSNESIDNYWYLHRVNRESMDTQTDSHTSTK